VRCVRDERRVRRFDEYDDKPPVHFRRVCACDWLRERAEAEPSRPLPALCRRPQPVASQALMAGGVRGRIKALAAAHYGAMTYQPMRAPLVSLCDDEASHRIVKPSGVAILDDKAGKPVGADSRIGRRFRLRFRDARWCDGRKRRAFRAAGAPHRRGGRARLWPREPGG